MPIRKSDQVRTVLAMHEQEIDQKSIEAELTEVEAVLSRNFKVRKKKGLKQESCMGLSGFFQE